MIIENFHVQPEVLFALAENSKFLYVPILAKFYIADSKFHILAGPQANIILEETGDDTKALGLDATFNAGYDINERFFVDARYSLELTNEISSDIEGADDVKARCNTFQVGIGYKF